jgi:hypothetical protein
MKVPNLPQQYNHHSHYHETLTFLTYALQSKMPLNREMFATLA